MRRLLLLAFTCCATVQASEKLELTDRDERSCIECHVDIVESFSGTRMAQATVSADFLAEHAAKGKPLQCMQCHAPSGGSGITCADCHAVKKHPYPKVEISQICARCHDASGENTLRSYRKSSAINRGEGCLDCHLKDRAAKTDHHFIGPMTPKFLDGIAQLRMFFRQSDRQHKAAVIQIRHRAGHALPGGTTGRSVWLMVSGIGSTGKPVWRQTMRFGWEHDPDKGWWDRTLPPDQAMVVEISEAQRNGAQQIKAELWYRFRAGAITNPDPRAVRLDAIELSLP